MSLHRLGAVFLVGLGALSCSAAGQYVRTTGACTEQRTACDTRCARLSDARDCEAACILDAKLCMRAQGDGGEGLVAGTEPPRISEHKAFLVDLFGARPKHSPELKVELAGDVSVVDGAHRLGPGGRVSVQFALPADTREAELALSHGPEGDGTGVFVTITLGEQTLAGRYAPPRSADGKLRIETWNLTPQLNELSPEARAKPLTLFVYNNDAAGSINGYRLGSIQLFYRTLGTGQTSETPGTKDVTAPR